MALFARYVLQIEPTSLAFNAEKPPDSQLLAKTGASLYARPILEAARLSAANGRDGHKQKAGPTAYRQSAEKITVPDSPANARHYNIQLSPERRPG